VRARVQARVRAPTREAHHSALERETLCAVHADREEEEEEESLFKADAVRRRRRIRKVYSTR
jgi:hypothetical protein